MINWVETFRYYRRLFIESDIVTDLTRWYQEQCRFMRMKMNKFFALFVVGIVSACFFMITCLFWAAYMVWFFMIKMFCYFWGE